MDVSIIIVNYCTSLLTRQTIGSVIDSTKNINYELIVVDNNSSDNSVDEIKAEFNELVRVIELPDNIGFGRANNEGLALAKGRNILFLNPDTILVDNPIKTLNDYLDSHPQIGGVGGNLYTVDMKPSHSFERLPLSIAAQLSNMLLCIPSRLIFGKNYNFNYTSKPLRVAQIVGADLMIRKKVLEDVGAFDTVFFMYCEESELCHRILRCGYKLVALPDSKIIHLEGQSFKVKETRELMWLDGMKMYMLKTHSKLYYKAYLFLYLVTIRVHSLKCIVLGKKEQRQFWGDKLRYLQKFNSNNDR